VRPKMKTAILAVVVLAVAPLAADTIYLSGSDGFLYTFDTTTDTVTQGADMGIQMSDIAFLNGTLYGVSFAADSELYTIDPVTGATNAVGATGTFLNALLGANGNLYAAGGVAGCNIPPAPACDAFYTVSASTGAASLVGTGVYDSSGDLVVDPNASGSLFLTSQPDASTDQLWLINSATGTGSLLGDIGYAEVFGIAYADGTLYGFNDVGNNVLTINTTTGAGTYLTSYSPNFEILGATVNDVPEPREIGIVLAGLSLAVGFFSRRKRFLTSLQ
jgi:hypothetical protein